VSSNALTDDQQSALDLKIQLIEAGPGSGKTRTVVERMRTLSRTASGGQALISFTNAAANEAMRRTGSSGVSLPPNFIGTFDKFLHRFLVTPWYLRKFRTRPRYLHSWDELGNGLEVVRHRHIRGSGLRLSSFHITLDGQIQYPSEAPGVDRVYVNQLQKAGSSPSALTHEAARRLMAQLSKGVYDCDCARLQALEILSSGDEQWLLSRLSLRFTEIIVDEFQDCSETEIQIIEALKLLGINVVVVADPDQAIYEFRQATPVIYSQFRDALDPKSVVELTTNHRSTPAICGFVSSLRMIGRGAIDAVQDGGGANVSILVGSVMFQRQTYVQLLESESIPFRNSIILSHKKKDAAALAGTAIDKSNSVHRTYRILRSVAVLRTSKSTRTRTSEIKRLGGTIVELFKWVGDEENLRPAEKRELLELTDADFASFGSALTGRSTDWISSEIALTGIIEQIGISFGNLNRPVKSLGVSLKKLDAKHWRWWETALENATGVSLPASHIHSVKGQEFDAVLLTLGSIAKGRPSVLDDWENRKSSDALRVFYVGASRAKKLLAIACHPDNERQLRQILVSHQIEANWMLEESVGGA
jgi:DNA helicase-2/ATP-dependent DNA helicase PcrA